MKRLTFEYVKEWVKNNSECILLSTEYKNAKTKLKFKCKCGKEFERTWDSFKRDKFHLCKSCSNTVEVKGVPSQYITKGIAKKPLEEVIKIVEEIGCKYIRRYTKKGTRSTIVEFECPYHGLQKVFWTNLEKRRCCPQCNEYNKQNSRLSQKVEKYLIENNIEYIREYKFDNCKNKRPLPFDFYIPSLKMVIEVNGRQHYEKAYFGGCTEEEAEKKLITTKKHDAIKIEFCKKNNIKYIEIPFFTDDKNFTYINILNKVILGEVTV